MDPFLIFRVGVFLIVLVLGFVLAKIVFGEVDEKRNLLLKTKNIVDGMSLSDDAVTRSEKKEVEKKIKEKRVKGLKLFYQQYVFFHEVKGRPTIKDDEREMLAKTKLIKIAFVGYVVAFVVYFLLSQNVLISLVLSFMFLFAYYFYLENKLKKKRVSYIKSFISSLDIISSSVQAGNSLEEGIRVLSRRTSVMPEMKQQFVLLNNHIKSNISMDEALDLFGKRNRMFEEFSMFVIVMQFFIKTGGKNLEKIFSGLQASLTQKVENYSIIESKLVTYEWAFNFFVFGFLGVSVLAPIFIPGFYENITTDPNGVIAVMGSVLILLFAIWMFKSSVKAAAEG